VLGAGGEKSDEELTEMRLDLNKCGCCPGALHGCSLSGKVEAP